MKNEIRSFTLNTEIKNRNIGDWNKIEAVNIPIGITVYLSDRELTNLEGAERITDLLEVLEDGRYAESSKLYLHTVGTSTEELELRLTAVSVKGIYFQNTKKQTVGLGDDVEEAIKNPLSSEDYLIALDKIMNPYDVENSSSFFVGTNATSQALILDTVADFDKAIFNLLPPSTTGGAGLTVYGQIQLRIDGDYVFVTGGTAFSSSAINQLNSSTLEIENLRGKQIQIYSHSYNTSYYSKCNIQKFNLKV